MLVVVVCLWVLSGVSMSTPLSGADNSGNKVAVKSMCLAFSDDRLVQFLQLGCTVKYQGDGTTQCAMVETCPIEAPKDQEQLMAVWMEWKQFMETGNVSNGLTLSNATDLQPPSPSPAPVPSTTTTARTVSLVNPFSRGRHSKCLRYRRTAVTLYKRMGCTVIPSRGCTVIDGCPADCSDERGEGHKLNSDPWFEGGNKQCRCENIRAVRAFVPRIPRKGTPFPPFKHCYIYGCVLPENDQYVKPNEQVVQGNGVECVCTEGSNPSVQDDAPPFHLDCGRTRK